MTYGVNPFVIVGPPLIGIGPIAADGIGIYAPSIATSYLFEAAHDLRQSASTWLPVTNAPIIIDDRRIINIPPTNRAFFLRLKKSQ